MMTTMVSGKWRRYSGYHPSGMEWLGGIPAHWRICRLKNIASVNISSVDKHTVEGEQPVRLCNYVDVYYNDSITQNISFMEATASLAEMTKFALKEGDVLITKDSEAWDDIAVPAYVATELEGVLCGYHLAHIRPSNAVVDGKYLFRAFSARGLNDQFRVEATGITRYGLSKYGLDNSLFFLPPLEEQRAIAAFLDRETTRIDALISKKERQIELLQEKRSALISHVVTKGLNPDVKLKSSGIEWIGEIPEHWEVNRLRHALQSISNGTTETQVDFETEFPVTRIESISKGTINYDNIGFVQGNNQIANYFLKYGDILFSHINSFEMVGNCAFYRGERPLYVGMNLLRLRPTEDVHPEFLLSWLKSKIFIHAVRMVSKHAINQVSIPTSLIKDLPFIAPSLSEQRAIAAFLDRETTRIDTLIEKVRDSIEKLREYRTALISAAVTGKIDVREGCLT